MCEVLAVYTTIYPGVEQYFAEWYRTVRAQTDQDFELWIGLDQTDRTSLEALITSKIDAHWVAAPSGCTPAQIRQLALEQIVEVASGVVLVDSDDLLHPSRVAAARLNLQNSDLTGCALRLVDQQGKDLGSTFSVPPHLQPEDILPRNNLFGFSNSAFRSHLLKRTFPIPDKAVLVDWFIASRAWLLGARLSFDRESRMDYRQHPRNMAHCRLPFSQEQVRVATNLVRKHFSLLLNQPMQSSIPERMVELKRVASEVEMFSQIIIPDSSRLADYVDRYNSMNAPQLWWSSVAHPSLSYLWNK